MKCHLSSFFVVRVLANVVLPALRSLAAFIVALLGRIAAQSLIREEVSQGR